MPLLALHCLLLHCPPALLMLAEQVSFESLMRTSLQAAMVRALQVLQNWARLLLELASAAALAPLYEQM